MPIESHALGAIIQPGTTLEEIQTCLNVLIEHHRSINWRIGDLVNAAMKLGGDQWDRQLPEYVHPEMFSRYSAVSAAYSLDERNPGANWTIHMQQSKNPNRIEQIQAIADAGQTSDEARKNPAPIPAEETPAETQNATSAAADEKPVSNDWLLCIDISYYVQRMFPTHGASTAVEVCAWLVRVIKYLRDTKNLTDAVVCFDGPNNHRKELTKDWEFGYKWKRTEKDEELAVQLRAIPDRLREMNLLCVSIEGMEADDVMASYVNRFDGKVTLMTADKDLRQCLGPKCNILKNVTWETSTETGALVRTFEWVSAKKHIEDGVKYGSAMVAGISPALWPHFQAIAGDQTDDIGGCNGIGGKGAMDLVLNHGTVQDVIAACKAGNAYVYDKHGNQKPLSTRLTQVVLDFEPIAETTLKLTTMRTDLEVPMTTKLALKEDS